MSIPDQPEHPTVDAATLRAGDRLWTGGRWEEVTVDAVEREGVVYVGTLRDGQARAHTFAPGEQVRAVRVEHPSWCDLQECTAWREDGHHRGTPARLDAARPGEPSITVQLLQFAYEPLDIAQKSVLIVFDHSFVAPLVIGFELEPWQATALHAALAPLVEVLATRNGSGAVELAVRALRAFGDLNREQAATLLPMWRYCDDLTDVERREVLAAFPPAPLPRRSGSGR